MAQKLITFLPEADRKYKSDTLSSILSASSVNRILANPNDRTLWINGWPFGHTFVSQNAAKPQPTNAEVFNFYTQFDANSNVIEGNAAYGNYSNAFGFNTVANNDFETAIGSLNYSIPSDYIAAKTSVFTIGIGDPSNYATMLNDAEYIPGATIPKDNNAYRKNALLVTKDGSIYLKNTSEIINSKNVEYTPCEYTGGPLTGNEKSLQRLVSDTMKLKSVTYAELISLRSLGQLVPGMKYRITDFTTTIYNDGVEAKPYIQLAPRLFTYDIIVEAISENKLSRIARATYPTLTSNTKATDAIHEWQLWYNLDNNKDVFPWADTRIALSYFTVQNSGGTPLFHNETSYGGADNVGNILDTFGTEYINRFIKAIDGKGNLISDNPWFVENGIVNETRAELIKDYSSFIYYDNYEYKHTYLDADNVEKTIIYTQRWLPFYTDVINDNTAGDIYQNSNTRETSAVDYYCALTEFLEPKDQSVGFQNILICLNETAKQINESSDEPNKTASELITDENYVFDNLAEYTDSIVDLTSNKELNNQAVHVNYTFLAPDCIKVKLFIDAEYTSYEPSNSNPGKFRDIEVEERYYVYDGPYYGSKFNQVSTSKTASYYKWIRTDASFDTKNCEKFDLKVNVNDESRSVIYRKPLYIPEGKEYSDIITPKNREYMVTEGLFYDGSSDFDWNYEGGRTPYPGTKIYGSYLETEMAKRIKSSDILYVNGEDARPDDYLGAIAYTKYDKENGREYYFSFSTDDSGNEIPYMLNTSSVFYYNDTTYMMWINTNSSDTTPIIITSPGADLDTLAELKYCDDDNIASALLKINFDDDGEYGSWLLYQDIKMEEVASAIHHCENSSYSIIRLPKSVVENNFEGYIPSTILSSQHPGYNFVRLYDKTTYKQSEYYQWVLSYNNGQSFEGPAKDKQETGIIADVLTTHSSLTVKSAVKPNDTYNDYTAFYYEPDSFGVYFHSYIIPLCKALPDGKFNKIEYAGKGIITRLIDEHGNDCPYDFKNITLLNGQEYFYTFSTSATYDGTVQDASLQANCKNNVIKFASLSTFPKTIFNSTELTTVVDLGSSDRGEIGGELDLGEGTDVGEDTETVETVIVSSDIMNNTVINCDNLIITNNCINSTFSNVTDTTIKREIYNSMFKNVSLGDDGTDPFRIAPFYCAYYNGPSNIINGIEPNIKTSNNGSIVNSSKFIDDQVIFSGDNEVIFMKNAKINSLRDFEKYVGSSSVKNIQGKSSSAYKISPTVGIIDDEVHETSYSSSETLLFDFSSLDSTYKLSKDQGSTDDSPTYTCQNFINGIFVIDIAYRYENVWLHNKLKVNNKMQLYIYSKDSSGTKTDIYKSYAYFNDITMPWDKSDHWTGVHLFWKIGYDVAAKINTAIASSRKVYFTLSDGKFKMWTNSDSCYAIEIKNFGFIPSTSASKISTYASLDSTGGILSYSGVQTKTSDIKLITTTESGSATVICSDGIVCGNSAQAYKLSANGAQLLPAT